MKTPATPTATAARASVSTNCALAAGRFALPARLLHRMRGVENHGRADRRHDRQRTHVGDQRIVAEGGAALAEQDVGVAALSSSLASTFFMSQGARNWPFLTLITRPVLAAATRRSVWRRQEGRYLQDVDDLAHVGALFFSVDVGQNRNAEFLLEVGKTSSAFSRPIPRLPTSEERFALSNEDL